MVKVSAPPPTWLRPDEVEDGDILTILAAPEEQSAEESKFKKRRLILPLVELPNKLLRKWGINNTTWTNLFKEFGDDPEQWINREVQIHKTIEKFGREEKTVLYGHPYGQRKLEKTQ